MMVWECISSQSRQIIFIQNINKNYYLVISKINLLKGARVD